MLLQHLGTHDLDCETVIRRVRIHNASAPNSNWIKMSHQEHAIRRKRGVLKRDRDMLLTIAHGHYCVHFEEVEEVRWPGLTGNEPPFAESEAGAIE